MQYYETSTIIANRIFFEHVRAVNFLIILCANVQNSNMCDNCDIRVLLFILSARL